VAAAVSSVFALELAHMENLPASILADAERLVPVTFLVIVGTVTVYGLTVGPLARRLKVAETNAQGILFAGSSPLIRELAGAVQKEGFPVLLVDLNQQNVAAARMAGLPVNWANICSEYALEELELGGIGRLLAMTPNDEVNSLAGREFVGLFGRAEVYQLANKPSQIASLKKLQAQLPARVLFREDAGFDYLAGRLADGGVVRVTSLTEEFDYNAFLRHYGSSALVMMVIDQTKRLKIVTSDMTLSPQSGQKLISLVDPPPKKDDKPAVTSSEG
jgi:Trk K+ transport system NAD-binding subunit